MINHLLTFGLDILWRRKAASLASKVTGTKWLDICSGTGEMAATLRKVSSSRRIVSSDFSIDMLRQASMKNEFQSIERTVSDSSRLPFLDDTFDLVTISYATRNLNSTRKQLITYLKEIKRVLKSDGMFINLETSQPRSDTIRYLFHLYIRLFVRRLGELISGSKSSYEYLSYTVPRFYGVEEFGNILKAAGFKEVKAQPFLFGTFVIHQAIV
jgi:demethylmenaquinone methyltransferase/2-methoxy-6-polyprenyl-1,4-benzoquinol methylase